MRNFHKAVVAVAFAGMAVAGGSAFTGSGLATTGQAAGAQFIGGTVSQSVTGGTLSSIVYGYTNSTNTSIDQVTLTFADANADTKAASIVFSAATPVGFTCENVGVTTTKVSTCLPTSAGTSQTGVTAVAVTVAS